MMLLTYRYVFHYHNEPLWKDDEIEQVSKYSNDAAPVTMEYFVPIEL